ncbi:MAG: hypothetical protein ABSG18_06800 [Steroidobacteraceae bacterium]|jgi:hypothetical protein
MTGKDQGSCFDIAIDKSAKGVTVYPIIVTDGVVQGIAGAQAAYRADLGPRA